jgi:hypothetical protein
LYTGEACNIQDLIEDHQGQYRADSWYGLQPEIGTGVVPLGMADDIGFECLDLILHGVHQMDVRLYVLAHTAIVKAFGEFVAIGAPLQLLIDAGEVVQEISQFDVRLKF